MKSLQLIAILSFFAATASAAEPALWVGRLVQPDVPLTRHHSRAPRPNESRRFGWVRVDASGMTETLSLGEPELVGTHLKIGSVLGNLRVGTLRGVLERTIYRPGVKRVYGVPVPTVFRIVHPTLFTVHRVGVSVVSKRPLLIPLPSVLWIRASEKNGKIHYSIQNRRQLELHIERQVDRILSDRWARHYFTFHLRNRPTLVQPALDRAFEYFRSEMLQEMRREMKQRILESGFIDELMINARTLAPPFQLRPGRSIDAFLIQDRRGTTRVWNLALGSTGYLPDPKFFRSWEFPQGNQNNQLQVGVTGPGLMRLIDLALANTREIQSSIPGFALPGDLEIDGRHRSLLVTPQSAAEVSATRSFFEGLISGPIPHPAQVEVTFPTPNATFSEKKRGVSLTMTAHIGLKGKKFRSTTLPVGLTFEISSKANVRLTEVKLPEGQKSTEAKNVLAQLGPGVQSLLLKAIINQKIEDAYEQLPMGSRLGEFVKIGSLGQGGLDSGMSVTFLEPLKFPKP